MRIHLNIITCFQNILKNIINYKSYIEKDEAEPKPLLYVSEHEDSKLNWIANRIIEIHSKYSEINIFPSIAIFVPNENQLENFASKQNAI